MARCSGRVTMMDDTEVANGTMVQSGCTPGANPGRPRPTDRWMADLLRSACGSPHPAEVTPLTLPQTSQTRPPDHLSQRLSQAVRWGHQERELAGYEAGLARRATLGEILAWARSRRGISPDELARRTGLGAECILAVEKGEVCPLDIAPERWARVAEALDVSIWTLLDRLQQIRAASTPIGHQVLPPLPVCPSPDQVWSTARRTASSAERVCVKEPSAPSERRSEPSSYCRAVYRAWREHQQDTPPE